MEIAIAITLRLGGVVLGEPEEGQDETTPGQA
jgi:hypothetical protein